MLNKKFKKSCKKSCKKNVAKILNNLTFVHVNLGFICTLIKKSNKL